MLVDVLRCAAYSDCILSTICIIMQVNTLTYPRHPDGAPKVPLDGYPGGMYRIFKGS